MLYLAIDVIVLAGRDVMKEPLEVRRALLEKKIPPRRAAPMRAAARRTLAS